MSKGGTGITLCCGTLDTGTARLLKYGGDIQWNTGAFDTPFARELNETNGTLPYIPMASNCPEKLLSDRVGKQSLNLIT